MERPNIDLTTLSFGKIFQVDPEGTDVINVQYGGDFLISTSYEEKGVVGYLASTYYRGQESRVSGLCFVQIEWKYLECLGSVNWFKKIQEKSGKSDSDTNG